jgi:hypothetical protein
VNTRLPRLRFAARQIFVLGVLLGSFRLGLIVSEVSARPAEAEADSPGFGAPDEFLDDPPGVPARPLPGAPPAEPIVFGPFLSRQVNVDDQGANIPGDAANEPSLAVDPTSPNHLAIGWRQFGTVSSNFREAGWGYSADGGRSWVFPGNIEAGVFRSDPVLDFDAAGTFYYSSLDQGFFVDIFKSFDRGASWSAGVPAFGGDKQWIAVDRTGGIGAGNMYEFWSSLAGCCGNNTFTRSTDNVQSFQTPIVITNNPRRGTLVVGPDGTLYATGVHPSNNAIFYVVRSANAQDPAATPTFVVTTVNMGGSLVRPVGNFGTPNPDGLLGQVWVVADHSSGPTAGNVYVLCSVDPPGPDPLDVNLVRSTDGGVTFSAPIRVNDDPAVAGAWQWFGTLAVAPNGRIDVVWNDTRSTLTPNISELYHRSSSDGGVTWAASQVLSPAWNSHVGFPNQNKIGDYYQLVSDRVGAHLAWAATLNSEQDIYYTRIGDYDCNSNGIPDTIDISKGTSPDANQNGIPDECEATTAVMASGSSGVGTGLRLDQNVPNPFRPRTAISFATGSAAGRARLRIYSAGGRLVRTLLDGPVAAGVLTVGWNAMDELGRRVPSGVYYYRLETPNGALARSMVVVE